MLRLISMLILCCSLFACTENRPKEATEKELDPFIAKQLVIVLSEHPDSVNATLAKFDWIDKQWQQAGETHDVTLGRTGLARSKKEGLLKGDFKQEGDGKSPAGLFEFGTAFGYAAKEAAGKFKVPYTQITAVTQCIEDSESKYYNQIVDNSKVEKDWETADFMQRKDDLYKWGIFVKHNTPAKANDGSCIFFHLWRGPGKHTAGCTAMTEENILNLIKWIDPKKEPRLVQLVRKDYGSFQKMHGLPKF